MADEVVILTSDTDEEISFCGELPSNEHVSNNKASNSDEELMNLNLDSPTSHPRKNKYNKEVLEVTPTVKVYTATSNLECNKLDSLSPMKYSSKTSLKDQQSLKKINTATTVNQGRIPDTKGKKLPKSNKHPIDKAYEKALKLAEAANKKSTRASECQNRITTYIDSNLLNAIPNSANILTQLQDAHVKHSVMVSSVPNSVHWKRENIVHFVNEKAEVCSQSTIVEETDGLIVLLAEDFVSLHHCVSLSDYIYEIESKFKKKNLTILVYGLSVFLKEQAREGNRQFRKRVTSASEDAPVNRNRKSPGRNIDYISSEEIEKLKVKLVVQTGCSLWPAETSEELGKIIVRLTKSVAERPFKEERLEQTFDFYADDVSGNIKVSKEGHGLERLWQQQLMQFPLVGLETSQAIASKYPSPQALIQAYNDCNCDKEASLLLQDIPIRRHAGPLSTSRKVGPELSKKIHKFLMIADGSVVL